MDSEEIFDEFVHPIGIGAIAVSAIFGIIRMGKIVAGSISLGFKGLKGGGHVEAAPRTQTDMSPRNVLLIQFGSTLLMALLFFVVAMNSPATPPARLSRWARAPGMRWSARWWASPCRSSSHP